MPPSSLPLKGTRRQCDSTKAFTVAAIKIKNRPIILPDFGTFPVVAMPLLFREARLRQLPKFRNAVATLVALAFGTWLGIFSAVQYSRLGMPPKSVSGYIEESLREDGVRLPRNQSLSDLEFTSTRHPMVRYDRFIVPNIVHFVKFGSTDISFTEMVCILSVHVNHKPEAIWVHCSLCVDGVTMHGKYWDLLMTHKPPIEVRHFPEPTHIFGKKLDSSYHAGDIARIQILMKHGGIYLDNDMFVINSLDHFRHYEMSLGWTDRDFMGSQLLVAHHNARFLNQWYQSYHHYNASLWYYNAGELPTTTILVPMPYLANTVKRLFGVQMLVRVLYKSTFPQWRDYFAMHLLVRHRSYLDKESPIKEFDETNIRTYNRTFGQMVRSVMFNTTNILT